MYCCTGLHCTVRYCPFLSCQPLRAPSRPLPRPLCGRPLPPSLGPSAGDSPSLPRSPCGRLPHPVFRYIITCLYMCRYMYMYVYIYIYRQPVIGAACRVGDEY